MNVDYWKIGASANAAWPTSQLELAMHIAADWVPTNPTSIGSGMVNLLGEIIRQETIKGNCAWVAHPDVAQFERQWRGITSFILGVSFCHKVMQDLGYTWCAPVSVRSLASIILSNAPSDLSLRDLLQAHVFF